MPRSGTYPLVSSLHALSLRCTAQLYSELIGSRVYAHMQLDRTQRSTLPHVREELQGPHSSGRRGGPAAGPRGTVLPFLLAEGTMR